MTNKTLLSTMAGAFLFGTLVSSCNTASADTLSNRTDHHSFSNPQQMVVRHVALDLTVDFDQRVLHGSASLDIERLQNEADTLMLDTRDLNIEASYCGETTVPF